MSSYWHWPSAGSAFGYTGLPCLFGFALPRLRARVIYCTSGSESDSDSDDGASDSTYTTRFGLARGLLVFLFFLTYMGSAEGSSSAE